MLTQEMATMMVIINLAIIEVTTMIDAISPIMASNTMTVALITVMISEETHLISIIGNQGYRTIK